MAGLFGTSLTPLLSQQDWGRAVTEAAPGQGLEEAREAQGHHGVGQGRMSPCRPRGVHNRIREGGQPWHQSTALPTACSCTLPRSRYTVWGCCRPCAELSGASPALLGEPALPWEGAEPFSLTKLSG